MMDKSIKVLYVDGRGQEGRVIGEQLQEQHEQLSLTTVHSSADALEALTTTTIDCIVATNDIPDGDGIELSNTLQAAEIHIPFILLIDGDIESVTRQAISNGISEYILAEPTGPVISTLATKITRLVDSTRTELDPQPLLKQQALLAALSQLGSSAHDVQSLLDEAVDTIFEHLPIEYVNILEYIPDQDYFMVRAARGQNTDCVGDPIIADSDELLPRYTLDSADSVIFTDHSEETRFTLPPAYAETGFQSGVAICLGNSDDPWGIISLYTTESNAFSPENITVFESIGHILTTGITRIKSEHELARSKTRIEALFEQSPDILLVHDRDGNITELNERACETLGYTRDELLEMTIWDIDPAAEPDRSRAFWADTEIGESTIFETEHITNDGRTFPVEVHLIRTDEKEAEFMAITRDIRERKAREEALERQTSRLETVMDAVAHDIPNHLSIAAGYLELAEQTGDPDTFQRVETAHRRIETLIEDMRTLVNVGETVTDLTWIRLSDIALACWESCCTPGDPATIDVREDGMIKADEARIKSLFENLYWNAKEHVGNDVNITVGMTADGFYVADDGPGIPSDIRDEVLKPGYTTAEGNHAGFGLAIVQEVANVHGWSIQITESESMGTRFEFRNVMTKD